MRVIALLPLLGLMACATVTKETQQQIQIATSPEGARCTATNNAGRWELSETPGEITVDRDFSPLTVECRAADRTSGTGILMPKTDPRAYGNIALGGVPALVDAHTGAGYVYEPGALTIDLR